MYSLRPGSEFCPSAGIRLERHHWSAGELRGFVDVYLTVVVRISAQSERLDINSKHTYSVAGEMRGFGKVHLSGSIGAGWHRSKPLNITVMNRQ